MFVCTFDIYTECVLVDSSNQRTLAAKKVARESIAAAFNIYGAMEEAGLSLLKDIADTSG